MERISSEAMLRFVERLEREDVCLHGFELRQDGEIRAEGYYAPFAKGQPHRMYSVSKSMVALALGLLLGEGRLRLTDHIVDFFPEALPAEPDPRLLRMTIEDMLRMTTCYRRTTYREGVDRDWAATFFRGDCTHEPGTLFHYDTSCTQVLGALCQRVSGQGLLELLEERIFHPIGATDPKRWLTDPSGVPQGGTGLIMSLRDLGKTAQLVMDGGRGLLPESFLRSATAKQVDTTVQGNPEERFGYGWQYWRTRRGWAMYGMGGQLAVACPAEGLLLCTIADTRLDPYGVQRIYDAFFEEIVAAPGMEHDGDAQRLERKLAALRVGGVPCRKELPWNFAPRYGMGPNELGLAEVDMCPGALTLRWNAGGEDTFQWDTFGQVRQGVFARYNEPCLVSAGMVGENMLRVRCHLIGDAPCGMDMRFALRNGRLSVELKRSTDPKTQGYDGIAASP